MRGAGLAGHALLTEEPHKGCVVPCAQLVAVYMLQHTCTQAPLMEEALVVRALVKGHSPHAAATSLFARSFVSSRQRSLRLRIVSGACL